VPGGARNGNDLKSWETREGGRRPGGNREENRNIQGEKTNSLRTKALKSWDPRVRKRTKTNWGNGKHSGKKLRWKMTDFFGTEKKGGKSTDVTQTILQECLVRPPQKSPGGS